MGSEIYDVKVTIGNDEDNIVLAYATKVTWDAEGNTSLQVIPVDTNNYYTSELTGEDAQAFYDYLEGISFGVSIDEFGNVTSN